jgi:hypothetical protein
VAQASAAAARVHDFLVSQPAAVAVASAMAR